MARVTDTNFYKTIASKTKKTETMVEFYTKAIIKQLFIEMNRGNSVTIKKFATFSPKLVGGCEMMVCGEKKYVPPRITINFSLTKAGIQILNGMPLDYDTKERIKNNKKLMPYEKEIIGEPILEKKDLRELLNKIIAEIKEENANRICDDDELDDKDAIDDIDEDNEDLDDETEI